MFIAQRVVLNQRDGFFSSDLMMIAFSNGCNRIVAARVIYDATSCALLRFRALPPEDDGLGRLEVDRLSSEVVVFETGKPSEFLYRTGFSVLI